MRTTLAGKPPLEEDPDPADTCLVKDTANDTATTMATGTASDLATGTAKDLATATARNTADAGSTTLVASVVGVDKRFGEVQALERLNIEVPKAKITVLLGPNGAGKTTAIRMITGAIEPDAGGVRVFGADPCGHHGEEIRRRCGVVSAKPSLYDRLSGFDNLRYAAELYGLGRGTITDRRIVEAAEQFGIDDALAQRVGGYSTGMKTRLALARSILHNPDLLLLDEPTSGLDPESAQAVLGMVRNMTSQGRSVLMCTHLLLEAEGLADEVVIIQDGTSLVWGDPELLSLRYWPRPEVTITARRGAELEPLRRFPEVAEVTISQDSARLVLHDGGAIGRVIHRLAMAGVELVAVEPYRVSLEDLYFAVRREHRLGLEAALGNGRRPEAALAPPDVNGSQVAPRDRSSDDQPTVRHDQEVSAR